MKVNFKMKLGATEFIIEDEVKNQVELVERLSFFSGLPKTGPNGEEDVYLEFRQVKGYKYYSLVCPSAKQEFKLGQYKDNPGTLFLKEWEPLHESRTSGGELSEEDDDLLMSTKKKTNASLGLDSDDDLLESKPKVKAAAKKAVVEEDEDDGFEFEQPKAKAAVKTKAKKVEVEEDEDEEETDNDISNLLKDFM